MDRYKITMPDGSSTEEPFNSDKEAITCAVDANRGVSKNLVVEKYTADGHLVPTAQAPAKHTGRQKKNRSKC
ncbi:hypothetical protein G9444_6021 [Rhodococcus erythropolis]|jgi:hypothetical protein|uniref:DUF2188 domain-containing protein n=1 Tax=Rhodococcus erythropolis TaxID=1833 RepID=A0A6G9D287_RHOER|nr:hypothetical protein G9444_6021 [Rhodococcus erythropolis]